MRWLLVSMFVLVAVGCGQPAAVDCTEYDACAAPPPVEVCDGVDPDCDGFVDGVDYDGDGQTGPCGDCDEYDATVYVGAPELCDGLDNDCDGSVPAAELVDADADGSPAGCGDCDDGEPTVYPGAFELCDGLDNDCDGVASAAVGIYTETYAIGPYLACACPGPTEDVDGDGFGCPDDCNFDDPSIFPGAIELCDAVDRDCDGLPYTPDQDGDGLAVCEGDCNDADPTIQPGAPEVCDGRDNDCDGGIDEGYDADGDGATSCGGDGAQGTVDDDCDDLDPSVRPGIADAPDGVDSDCDGLDADPCGAVPVASPAAMRDLAVLAVSELRAGGLLSALATGLSTAGAPVSAVQDWGTSPQAPVPYTLGPPVPMPTTSGFVGSCVEPGGGVLTSTLTTNPNEQVVSAPSGNNTLQTQDWSEDWMQVAGVDVGGLEVDGLFVEASYENLAALWNGDPNNRLDEFALHDGVVRWCPSQGTPGHATLQPGTTTLSVDATLETYENTYLGSNDQIGLVFGSLTWFGESGTPWTLNVNLAYQSVWYDGDGLLQPPGQATGCALEPDGTLSLEVYAPSGAMGTSVELVFDGSTTCDGCAEFFTDGVSQGSWCTALLGI